MGGARSVPRHFIPLSTKEHPMSELKNLIPGLDASELNTDELEEVAGGNDESSPDTTPPNQEPST
jgi:hypothetical protein